MVAKLGSVGMTTEDFWSLSTENRQKYLKVLGMDIAIDKEKEGVAKEKIVLGWRMVKDEVRFDGKILREDQIFRLFLNEGEGKDPSEVDVNIFQYTRDLKRIKGEVVKEIKTNDGIFKRLRFEDGQELDFDVKFLNP